jgi:hypothetical protein
MEPNEDSSPAIEEVLAATATELLLTRPRDVRIGRPTREQLDVLQRIEVALETYESYFYSLEHR